jgi:hypothetical protein
VSLSEDQGAEKFGRQLIERVPTWFLPNAAVDRNLAVLDRTIFEAWLAREIEQLREFVRERDPLKTALRIIAQVTQRITGRPLENRPSADSLMEREFFDRPFARLVFGYTNCEGLAYLVYRLVDGVGLDATLVETETEFRHTLIVLKDENGWTLLDPYADFHHYHIRDFPLAEVLGDSSLRELQPYAGSPEYDTLGYPNGSVIDHGLYPGAGALLSRPLAWKFDERSGPPLESLASSLDAYPPTEIAFLTEYLRVRHAHLWHKPPSAGTYANLAIEHQLGGFTKALLLALERGGP